MKLLLSIGGGSAMGSGHYAAVASDSHASQKFVDTAKELVDKYDLDGLDGIISFRTCGPQCFFTTMLGADDVTLILSQLGTPLELRRG